MENDTRGISMHGEAESLLSLELVVPCNTRYLSLIGNIAEEVAKEVHETGVDRDTLAYHLNLALTEAVVNAIQHGAQFDPAATVRIYVSIDDKSLRVQIYDHGKGFDLKAAQQCEAPRLEEHGRGIFLIRSVMDSVEYRKANGGNVLEMRKSLAHRAPLPA
jgi:serine/threonine-protein kinase RsbW